MAEEIPSTYVGGLFDGGVEITLRIESDDLSPTGYNFYSGLRFETKNSPRLVGVLAEFAERHGVLHEATETSDGFLWFVTGEDRVRVLLEAIQDEVWAKSEEIELMLDEIIPRLEEDVYHTEEGILELMEHAEKLEWRERVNQFNKITRETFEDEFDITE